MTPLRDTGSVFAETRNPTLPSPWPFAFDVSAIHEACEAAFHVQSRSIVTDTLPVPPAAANLAADDDTFAWHLALVVLDGAAMLVEVELPQPAIDVSARSSGSAHR